MTNHDGGYVEFAMSGFKYRHDRSWISSSTTKRSASALFVTGNSTETLKNRGRKSQKVVCHAKGHSLLKWAKAPSNRS